METVTSTTLLEAIRNDEDHSAWGSFVGRYRPMIVSFAHRLGLEPSDAEDVAQETLMAFLQRFKEGQFDRQKGRLRTWFFSIAQSKVVDTQRRSAREYVLQEEETGTSQALPGLEISGRIGAIWEEEWERTIVNASLAEVGRVLSPQTMAIFELHVVQEWPVEKVAAHLEVTPNVVYMAKMRALRKFREFREKMEENW